jgi:hypothetical protein
MTFQDPMVARLVAQGGGGLPVVPTMTGTGGPQPAACSFCGRRSPMTGMLFAGPRNLTICEHCVEQAHTMLLGSSTTFERSAPEDPDRARAEIFEAFANINTIGGPGDADLPFVADGAGLAQYQQQAAMRHPGVEVVFMADHVQFLSATLAEVHYRITGTMNMSFSGAAVIDAGRWKVARETLTSLLAGAGVFIPPRAA